METLEGLKGSVSSEAVGRAKKLLEAEIAFSRDGSYALASYINEAIALGDWAFFATFMNKVEKVKPEELQRIVKQYFVPEQMTTGYFIHKNQA